jgi:hypothetical protein
MSDGYIYCFSNPSMPDLVKVGMTERTPDERLYEANVSNTWIPLKFKIEFAKKCINPKKKEKMIHNLLSKYEDRVNESREFFKVTPEVVKMFFDLIDGEYWDTKTYKINAIIETPKCMKQSLKSEFTKRKLSSNSNRPNDLSECFKRDTELIFRKSAIKGTVQYAVYCISTSISESKIFAEDGNSYYTFNKWATTCNKGQKYNAYSTFYKSNNGEWIICDLKKDTIVTY